MVTSSMDATEGGKQKVLQGVLVQLEALNLLALWHMQTENSGIENLENKNINQGAVLLHAIMLLFCREGKMPSAQRQSQSFGHMHFDANEKISY